MNSRKTTIKLSGELGSKFGRVHRAVLDSNSTAEAIRYICSQFPAAAGYFYGADGRGIRFAVFRGKENLRVEQLHEPVGEDVIRIAPILMGSKRAGTFSVILGAVIVAASVVLDAWTDGGFSAATGGYTYTLGYGLIVGGLIQMLTPVPKGGKGQDRPENAPSYVFSGAVNTQAQGNPVPLLYGRMIVGSAVISAGINAEDYAPATSGVGPGNPHWNPKNPYEIFA
jgi:predicted phage tail protein